MRRTRRDKRVLFNGSTRGCLLFLFLSDICKILKHLIRDNANLLILFKQDDINLKHVYNDHVNTDMFYEDFCKLCRNCWTQKYGFLVINKDSALSNGRYRKFNDFAIPQHGQLLTIHRYVTNMDEKIKDRERIVKQIAKTSDSIRKKYCALKAGKLGEDIALKRYFKPLVETLKQIVENTISEKSDMESDENETFFLGEEPKPERKRSNTSFDNSLIPNFYSN